MTGHRERAVGGGGDSVEIVEAAGPIGRQAGLLAKLMAAVRPQFRAEDLIFDPRDPVFGAPACAVPGCVRPQRKRGMCPSHVQRWVDAGKPDLEGFVATTTPLWYGHRGLGSCAVPGCGYGLQGNGMCRRHAHQWRSVGCPDRAGWLASPAPLPAPAPPPRTCRIGYCDLWAQGPSVFCRRHDDGWRERGRPDAVAFTASYEDPGPGGEHIDLRALPVQLRLEVAYVLQCRRDEEQAKLQPARVS